jgi:NTE family protein
MRRDSILFKTVKKITKMDRGIENCVFEGGGVRGVSYCGSFNILQSKNILSSIKRFGGSSIGSLYATMAVCGFTPKEIQTESLIMNFSQPTPCCLSILWNCFCNFGIKSADHLETQVRHVLEKKVNPDITLSNLYKKTNKDLVIVSTCITRKQSVYFHHSRYPDVKLIEALIASMCMPGYFYPREFDSNVFSGIEIQNKGKTDMYIDGGLSDNYPLWIFNDIEKLYSGDLSLVDRQNISKKTIGFKLLSEGESNTVSVYKGRVELDSMPKYFTIVLDHITLQLERLSVSQSYIEQTIGIKTGSVESFDFGITTEEKLELIRQGELSTKKYLDSISII